LIFVTKKATRKSLIAKKQSSCTTSNARCQVALCNQHVLRATEKWATGKMGNGNSGNHLGKMGNGKYGNRKPVKTATENWATN